MGNFVARVSPVPLNRPRITRSAQRGHRRDAQGTAPLRRPRTDIRPPFGTLNANSATMQPLSNSDTDATNRHSTISQTIQQPLSNPDNHREPQPHPQPSFNRHATASQPRTNHNRPSCRIKERFRHNHPTSTILESTTLSCTALARPSTVLSKSGRFALASQSHDMVQYVPAMAKAKVTGRRRGLR